VADVLQEISTLHVTTATEAVGVGYAVLPGDAMGARLAARIQYLAATEASGSGVWTFTVQVSYTQGASWTTVATGAAITLTTVSQNAEQLLTFSPTSQPVSGQTWVQVLATLSGAGVTNTIAYRADLVGGPFG
jgi:hypothetical protein